MELEKAINAITDDQIDDMIRRAKAKVHEKEADATRSRSEAIRAAIKAKKDKE